VSDRVALRLAWPEVVVITSFVTGGRASPVFAVPSPALAYLMSTALEFGSGTVSACVTLRRHYQLAAGRRRRDDSRVHRREGNVVFGGCPVGLFDGVQPFGYSGVVVGDVSGGCLAQEPPEQGLGLLLTSDPPLIRAHFSTTRPRRLPGDPAQRALPAKCQAQPAQPARRPYHPDHSPSVAEQQEVVSRDGIRGHLTDRNPGRAAELASTTRPSLSCAKRGNQHRRRGAPSRPQAQQAVANDHELLASDFAGTLGEPGGWKYRPVTRR
jgi:hypothetical protein